MPHPEQNPPPLDLQAIDSLRALSPGDGGALLKELVDLFLQDTPQRLAEIEAALAAGDTIRFARAAHSIKGSAGNFGATQLAALAQQIEHLGKEGNAAAVPPVFAGLAGEFARVKTALEAVLRDA